MDHSMNKNQPKSFGIPDAIEEQLNAQLILLYGDERAPVVKSQLIAMLGQFAAQHPRLYDGQRGQVTAADAMLITYGDQLQADGMYPLEALQSWLAANMEQSISSVHVLPFYPYTSDDGFSVVDYNAVDPALGNWSHIEALSRQYKVMFDAVINHISAQSAWFQGFLKGDPQYADYFLVIDDPNVDLSLTTRPRTHPLLTTFETATGPHRVWTTFSTDQIDLNFGNPDVLLAVIDVLLGYVAHGARYVRLDAIGYLWKTPGTRSIHLPEAHAAVQLVRSAFDAVAPDVVIITETNVPHADNVAYFGDGYNEAQLVYQFPLAPLVLNAFQSASSHHLRAWATALSSPSADTTFFNFLASHDGIGVVPASGILSPDEVGALVDMTIKHGGLVSYKTNSDGSQSPYELNITFFDAISDPSETPEPIAIDRFIGSQAIMLALAGMPGIYIHSLVGSSNNHAGVAETGRARTINRQKWQRDELQARLDDASSRERRILKRYIALLKCRAQSSAFDPQGRQIILASQDALFVILRVAPDEQEAVICIHNLSDTSQTIALQLEEHLGWSPTQLTDLLGTTTLPLNHGGAGHVEVSPFAVMWLLGKQ